MKSFGVFFRKNTAASIQDPAVFEECQSEPLYCDITSEMPDAIHVSEGLIRAKYRGQSLLSVDYQIYQVILHLSTVTQLDY